METKRLDESACEKVALGDTFLAAQDLLAESARDDFRAHRSILLDLPIISPTLVGLHQGFVSPTHGHKKVTSFRTSAVRVMSPCECAECSLDFTTIRGRRNVKKFVEIGGCRQGCLEEVVDEVRQHNGGEGKTIMQRCDGRAEVGARPAQQSASDEIGDVGPTEKAKYCFCCGRGHCSSNLHVKTVSMTNVKPSKGKKKGLRSGKYPDTQMISFPTAQNPGARPPAITTSCR